MNDHHKIKSDLYGRKYCSSCRMHQEQIGGEYKATRSTKRWVCMHCLKRTRESGFSTKRKITHGHTAQ